MEREIPASGAACPEAVIGGACEPVCARCGRDMATAQRSAPVDWPARFRAAAEVADGPWLSDPAGALYATAHVLEQTPPHVVEDIGRALTEGETR